MCSSDLQSTFMVEMMEVSNILNHATKQSLLILDEIGRGTSTIDGLSIAWAIIEYIADKKKLGAKTLFATHYHELTSLEETISGLKNYCVTVKEMGEDIIFLRKIAEGSVDHSYGIQVAKLAGLPKDVLERAKAIMASIEREDSQSIRQMMCEEAPVAQLSFFTSPETEIINKLKNLDLLHLTPFEAMQELYQLQQQVQKCQ